MDENQEEIPLTEWRERFRERYAQMQADGITQGKLGNMLGVTQSTIGHWLSGRRAPDTLSMFSKLAAAVGMPAIQLLFGIEPAQVVTKEGAEVARAWETLPEGERVALKTAILMLQEQLSKQDNL
jgi:transcriptional regulator with XRE-family HTH domain